MGFIEDKNLMNAIAGFRVKCKCGHSTFFVTNREKIICHNCGEYIYKNKKIEFKEKLLKEKRKLK